MSGIDWMRSARGAIEVVMASSCRLLDYETKGSCNVTVHAQSQVAPCGVRFDVHEVVEVAVAKVKIQLDVMAFGH
jgi:hypothetical protein